MDWKFKLPDEVVAGQIVDIVVIVNIVDFNFIPFLLLEMEVNCNFLDELRV